MKVSTRGWLLSFGSRTEVDHHRKRNGVHTHRVSIEQEERERKTWKRKLWSGCLSRARIQTPTAVISEMHQLEKCYFLSTRMFGFAMCLVNGKLLFALSFHFRLFLLWWYLSISRVGDLFKHKEWTNARNMHHQLNFFFLLSKCDLLGWLPIIFRPVTVVRFSLGVARPRSPSVVGARRDHHFWWGAQSWTRSWRLLRVGASTPLRAFLI